MQESRQTREEEREWLLEWKGNKIGNHQFAFIHVPVDAPFISWSARDALPYLLYPIAPIPTLASRCMSAHNILHFSFSIFAPAVEVISSRVLCWVDVSDTSSVWPVICSVSPLVLYSPPSFGRSVLHVGLLRWVAGGAAPEIVCKKQPYVRTECAAHFYEGRVSCVDVGKERKHMSRRRPFSLLNLYLEKYYMTLSTMLQVPGNEEKQFFEVKSYDSQGSSARDWISLMISYCIGDGFGVMGSHYWQWNGHIFLEFRVVCCSCQASFMFGLVTVLHAWEHPFWILFCGSWSCESFFKHVIHWVTN